MQDASFPFELVIVEDCSTDRTRAIVEGYAAVRPDIIRPVFHAENLGGAYDCETTLSLICKGEFIAFLEGDDYWTDSKKLRLQVEFLEAHPGAALCHHLVTYLDDETGKDIKSFPPRERRIERCSSDLLADENFIQTCSLMLRREMIPELTEDFFRLTLGDWPLCVLVGQNGWIGYIDRNMATYRVHSASIWSSQALSLRLAAGIEMGLFLTSHLKGKSRKLWIDFVLRERWKEFWRARDCTRTTSDLARATKRVLASTIWFKPQQLPRCLWCCIRTWASFLKRSVLKPILPPQP
jgi:glycosyltransferase involved in cell wall biosynthesis